ncbi:MAG: phosphotransferase [Candidatus Roizmanbacteria bacterium]|nr:phosphotransferase [Candidatus Roizmanbacteria bacterium]
MNVNTSSIKTPSKQDAIEILQKATGENVAKIERFPTGSQHYVFDVLTENNKQLVIRIGTEETRGHIAGSVYWHSILKDLGVPLPHFLFSETERNQFEFPVIIMERLLGKDLVYVYEELSKEQKKKLAFDISAIQKKVGTLPSPTGFGFARSYEDSSLKSSWYELIESQLKRTRIRMTEVNLYNLEYLDKTCELVKENNFYLKSITPVAFLDDTTTKNVIIHNGELSGIVDVDFVCFGDPLYVFSLTKMAFLSNNFDMDYISYWLANLNLTAKQQKAIMIYTMIHCVGFMSELGQKFNKNEPNEVKREEIDKLKTIINKLMKEYGEKNIGAVL